MNVNRETYSNEFHLDVFVLMKYMVLGSIQKTLLKQTAICFHIGEMVQTLQMARHRWIKLLYKKKMLHKLNPTIRLTDNSTLLMNVKC